MGWASGSKWAETLWREIKDSLPVQKKHEVAMNIVDFFEANDADAWSCDKSNSDDLYFTARPEEKD